MHMNPGKVGLVGGVLFGGFHLIWSILVATGMGQALYDFVLWAHMIHVAVIIGPFDVTAFITLVIMTTIVGYCVGYALATVWNRVHRA